MKYAIISVSNKNNIINLVNALLNNSYSILSTGGTYKHILENIEEKYFSRIIKISEYTEFPEILSGRVKTLHPKIYGGILYDKKIQNADIDLENNGIEKIDLVAVNLYPFQETIKNSNDEDLAIENIDIGGVSLIRAAAKNYRNVMVLTDEKDYQHIIDKELNINLNERRLLAGKAFEHIAEYDMSISMYFNPKLHYRKYSEVVKLKYGCNPYQDNSYLLEMGSKNSFDILNGIPGYINYIDAFHSWLLVSEIHNSLCQVAAASFKHTAPAGVGLSLDEMEFTDLEKKMFDIEKYDLRASPSARAFIRARNCDPLSSFGDFMAISDIVDETCALLIKREVSDGIIALGYTDSALEILKKKKGGKFIILKANRNIKYNDIEFREIFGQVLSQRTNNELVDYTYLTNITTKNKDLSLENKKDLILATITLKYTPSNSIAYARNGMVIGIGAGQQNRVDCIKLAGNKSRVFILRQHPKCIRLLNSFKEGIKRQDKTNAIIKYINNDFTQTEFENWCQLFPEDNIPQLLTQEEISEYLESVSDISLSSDAFFPFRDNIDYASRYGVKYIVHPGGSIQDDNVRDACDEYDMVMALSGKRLFLH